MLAESKIYEDMDVDHSHTQVYIDNLDTKDHQQLLFNLKQVRNLVIGSNRNKTSMMACGIVQKLLQVLTSVDTPADILVECAVIMGSLAQGTDSNRTELMEEGVMAIMMQGLADSHQRFMEACLRFLRTMFVSPNAPTEIIFEDVSVVPRMIQILPKSGCTQECVAKVLASCCKTPDQQKLLLKNGAIPALAPLLKSDINKIRLPALQCFAAMSHQNKLVCSAIASARCCDESLPVLLSELLCRSLPSDVQLTAAKCLCSLSRAKSISATDPIIVTKTLPCLVRMCKRDCPIKDRVAGAETLAMLVEEDVNLQKTASMTDHLIPTIASYLNIKDRKGYPSESVEELKQAAFMVFAAISANDEEIRKKIIETEPLMDDMEQCMSDENYKVRLAAVRCLHSLSRSVQQLRTSFQDHGVWRPLMKILQTEQSEDLMVAASSTICNLLLEFSPSKSNIVESGAVMMFCKLTGSDNMYLRLNGIWGLMNMAFQSEQKIKNTILTSLGTEQLFKLLTDDNVDILMKTLGLLRNLLSSKGDIDIIMDSHNKQIMTAVVMILEGNHPPEVKEQTLCILANIADGNNAKDFIMSNEDILKKLTYYMRHENVKLQVAAVYCINNLVWKEEEGADQRQRKLKEFSVYKQLQSLLSSADPNLFDKVKTALQQFTQ